MGQLPFSTPPPPPTKRAESAGSLRPVATRSERTKNCGLKDARLPRFSGLYGFQISSIAYFALYDSFSVSKAEHIGPGNVASII